MEFRFDADQAYQIDAIEAVAGLFDGQARHPPGIMPAAGAIVSPNRLDLTADDLLANLRAVQTARALILDTALQTITETVPLYKGPEDVSFPNVSVEMETGTGKTYVYLRTALTLAARYGLRKFIIVVPSVAIREGVIKTLKQTKAHFEALPDLPPYHYEVYDSAKPGQVRGFASSTSVELMVMTIDAFAKAENVINKPVEGNPPLIHMLQAVRPVLILDEPQNMESENRVRALASLHPLVALRYSATHRNPYNVVYRLTPFDAYRQELVKRIEIADVLESDNANLPRLKLEGVEVRGKTIKAAISVDKMLKSGKIKKTTIKVKFGDDLEDKTGRSEYQGFIVDEIDPTGAYVRFLNNFELPGGQEVGSEREAIFEAQIRFTIEEHFRKQERLRGQGIKVLSLFFIDRVASFADDDGWVRALFVKAFDEVKGKYPAWKGINALDVQKAYFATKKRKSGAVEVVDTSGATKEDNEAFRLIMQDKERLLSFDEPTAFVFSHSALKEGWDSPNVFQICVLREVNEMTRRQQIGRGVRLAVDQTGERVRDMQVNRLTVVASETYEQFAQGLQSEIEAEYGIEGVPPKPPSTRDRRKVKLRKALLAGDDFKALWDRIKHRTRYAVEIDSAALVEAVVSDLNEAHIRQPRIVISKAALQVGPNDDTFEAIVTSGAKTAMDLGGRYALPNLLEVIESMMEVTSPPMRLSRGTLLAIIKATTKKAEMVANPHDFAATMTRIVKDRLTDQLVGGIRYEKDGSWYEQTQFLDEIESYADRIVDSAASGGAGGTHVYDGVIVDSETVERPFAEALEKDARVKVYIKLPDWFTVKTPIGNYNPDWAVVLREDGEERLFLVRETKGSVHENELRPDERRKVQCGRRHFADALGVDFKLSSGGLEV